MGQYHKLVNFDKKEFVNPHEFGNGLKLWEQVCWQFSFSNITHYLLATCTGRGGGDFENDNRFVGSWGGDRVALVGDYAEPTDFPFLSREEFDTMMSDIWDRKPKGIIRDKRGRFASPKSVAYAEYQDISLELRPFIEKAFVCKYTGDGWGEVKDMSNQKVTPKMKPDLVIGWGR